MRALLVFAVLLAGCAGTPATDLQVLPDSPSEPTSHVVVTPPAEPPSASDERGTLRGVVTATNGSALEGARVELVGVAEVAVTDNLGTYALTGLPEGEYLVHVRRDGYAPASSAVAILSGATTVADVTLAPLVEDAARADFWHGRDQVRVTDGSFTGADSRTASTCLAGAKTRWSAMPTLRFDAPRQLVWPGTSEIIVILDWDEATFASDELAIVWRNHPDGAYALTPLTPKGQAIRIAVAPESADLPRQSYTRWELGVCAKDQSGDPAQRTAHFDGVVHATVDLVRGHPIPTLPPEPTLWAATTRLPVLDEARSFTFDDPTVWAIQPCNGPVAGADALNAGAAWWTFTPAQGLLVPPGTTHLEASLQWSSTDLLGSPEVDLAVRSAAVPPWVPDGSGTHAALEPIESAPGQQTYRFPVAAAEWDGWDDARSAWSFRWSLADGAVHACMDLEVRLRVDAVREP